MDELKLWQHIQSGEMKALKELHSRYYHALFLFTLKSINDYQLAENLVSDCFIKLWENRQNIIIKSSVKSYLYRILKNLIIDNHRSKTEITELFDKLPDIPDEQEFEKQQRYARLYQILQKLPEQRRNILELAVYDSCSYEEIAEKLGISKNTVKTQIARAYRFLRESLDPGDFYFYCLLKKS